MAGVECKKIKMAPNVGMSEVVQVSESVLRCVTCPFPAGETDTNKGDRHCRLPLAWTG